MRPEPSKCKHRYTAIYIFNNQKGLLTLKLKRMMDKLEEKNKSLQINLTHLR